MNGATKHNRGRSGDFIVKLKKKYTFLPFYVWISEFRMGGYFLKTFFLNRQFKKSSQGTVLNFHVNRHSYSRYLTNVTENTIKEFATIWLTSRQIGIKLF